ncbi:MAG: PDZ domain-containing protein [Planctomycetota bacterium]|nr:PDZ domain-containing protein [Planctomycetota bacterium]
MPSDGTIYHTYAGRDAVNASSHQSQPSMARALDAGLATHERYARAPKPPKARKKVVIEKLPRWRREKKLDCYHCHQVYEGEQPGLSGRDAIPRWPDPAQIGIEVERDDQQVIRSAAAKTGLKPGDRLLRVGGRDVATFGDVQRALDEARGTQLDLVLDGGRAVKVKLPKGWRQPDPAIFHWRATKWTVSPRPGFGGPNLTAAQKTKLGLKPDAFAFRVQYLVTWGRHRKRGGNAHRHGIRKGQVILAVNGKSDFQNESHFQAWFSLTRKVGERMKFEVIEGGKRKTLTFKPVG